MERHCPICGHLLAPHDIVCQACHHRLDAREPARRETVLYGWGRALMLFLAFFLFVKGAYATLSPVDYARAVRALDLPSENVFATSLNAAFALAASLLYVIAWIGSYLRRHWDAAVCLAALIVFVAGQALTQVIVVHDQGGPARAIAVFLFWIVVPVVQYITFRMGRESAGAAEADAQAA